MTREQQATCKKYSYMETELNQEYTEIPQETKYFEKKDSIPQS